jgi:(p)ppGpp synthase/HD superfamily hydrolase
MDAEFYHHEQRRKSTNIPYFSHLLGVCGLVLEAGGSATEAIAALLHDAPEDAGGAPVLAAIGQNFGTAVATIVSQLSDGLPVKGARKGPWLERKTEYLRHLRDANAATVLVSAADKLHNLRAIQSDYREIGNAVFERFGAPDDKRTNTLWYYRLLFEVFTNRDHGAVDPRLARLTRPLGEILDWFDEQEPVSRRGTG